MNKIDEVMQEIKQVPEPLLDEVLDFVRFIKSKAAQERAETALLSETVLAREWLGPEEDAAWQGL